jgi:hypothetical protein
LSPDLLISPSVVGIPGDSITVIVTIRDIRLGTAYGTRVASAKFSADNPEAAMPALTSNIFSQIETLSRTPTFVRVRPPKPPEQGKNEQ